ncbi:EcoKI restriction-modification system protein HsdS [Pirellulimonas nuda]|uniref:EcoKI restriction-modification system protein HsdS n=1 Tax=Pirellulimonas nuda TaxID=2528009 RepID=A0A518D8Z7_9BACT|nr:restriction endonuclease subunit S [Pirellulimonas nuda]QDU87951.1 EcoKI restriction-modification system protein HsdS [Pirellulimonas nuda]
MAGEWEEVSVAELQASGALLVEDGNHGENRPRPNEFSTEGIQFIRAADMDSGRVLFERAQRINEIARQRVRKGIGAGGDVLLSHKGTVGKVAYVPLTAPPFVCSPQTTFWRVKDPTQLDRRYIYFYLLSRAFREQLDSRKGETDMADYVSLTTQRTLKVTVPPLAEQKAIASVLGALDDKIELNRRTNATLEAMARALFQSWFVDFDPVRAKLDGRQPAGMDAATAGLFPASFYETKVGHIPVGWQLGRLADLCNLKRGHDLPTSSRTAGPIPVISSSGISGTHSETNVRGPGVVTGRYGTIGKVFYVEADYWPLNTTLYVEDFKANPPRFIFHALGQVDFANYTDKAAVPGVNRNHLHEEPTVLPTMEARQAFAHAVAPLWLQHAANDRLSHTLATLRDTLLPKLLSGELRVGEAREALSA